MENNYFSLEEYLDNKNEQAGFELGSAQPQLGLRYRQARKTAVQYNCGKIRLKFVI